MKTQMSKTQEGQCIRISFAGRIWIIPSSRREDDAPMFVKLERSKLHR